MLPLVQILTALAPFAPIAEKVIDKRAKGEKYLQGTTGQTEALQGGYMAALTSIAMTVDNCAPDLSLASMACVSTDQWAMLISFAVAGYARFKGKKSVS